MVNKVVLSSPNVRGQPHSGMYYFASLISRSFHHIQLLVRPCHLALPFSLHIKLHGEYGSFRFTKCPRSNTFRDVLFRQCYLALLLYNTLSCMVDMVVLDSPNVQGQTHLGMYYFPSVISRSFYLSFYLTQLPVRPCYLALL